MGKSFNLSKFAQNQYKSPNQPITQGRVESGGVSISREGTKIIVDGVIAGQEAIKLPIIVNLLQNLFIQNPAAKQFSTESSNLKTAQQPQVPWDPMGLNDSLELNEPMDMNFEETEQPEATESQMPEFIDGSSVKQWLDNNDPIDSRTQLIDFIQDIDSQQKITDMLDLYYESNMDENQKLKIATDIFELLPEQIKQPDPNDQSTVIAPYVEGSVQESENTIKLLAEKIANSKKAKTFNLTKTAQHKGFENVMMFGPDQMKVDTFLRQPVSNLALLERNKGFGLVVDDVWDIDYEAIWRSTIMDKYSRPYRDKDGNWVGGYIQKRFEVDKNIPITNNMQLKPGQRMKPILPEYGLIEGRMEFQREKEAKKTASVKPFNCKEAQVNKFYKISQNSLSIKDALDRLRMGIEAYNREMEYYFSSFKNHYNSPPLLTMSFSSTNPYSSYGGNNLGESLKVDIYAIDKQSDKYKKVVSNVIVDALADLDKWVTKTCKEYNLLNPIKDIFSSPILFKNPSEALNAVNKSIKERIDGKETSNPLNLEQDMADKKKSELTAQIKDLKPIKPLRGIGEPAPTKVQRTCPHCGSNIKGWNTESNEAPPTQCPNCGLDISPVIGNFSERKPFDKGEKINNPFSTRKPEFFQKNTPLSANDNNSIKQSSMPDKKEKRKPRASDEHISDEFKQCPKRPNYYDMNEEIARSCEDLAIDG